MIKKITIIFIILLLMLVASIFFILYGSLPKLNDKKYVAGLNHSIVINRDKNGVALVEAENRIDAALALGFLHGQDRFFQMDLLRRSSSGELAELLGKKLISFDKERRLHDLKNVAKKIFNNLSSYEQQLLKAYTIGVNNGIKSLRLPPFEYFLLFTTPRLWEKEDSILVSLSLFFALQDSVGKRSLVRWLTLNQCGESIYKFLFHNGSIWEAALDGSTTKLIPFPPSSAFEYLTKEQKNERVYHTNSQQEECGIGSNHWAMSGKFTKDGKAILACDPHLDLTVPNSWYHVALKYKNNNEEISVVGATLPGTPLMVFGSNDYISWGFTNSKLDSADLIILGKDDKIWQRQEIIKVKGGDDVLTTIDQSQWGPVLPNSYLNQRLALRWIAHNVQACNFSIITLELQKDVTSAMLASQKPRGPSLNLMFADKNGNIGWALAGAIAKRIGYNGELPIRSDSEGAKTFEIQDSKLYPTIYNPKEGFLFTANNRIVDSSVWETIIGHGTYTNPIRAYQIKQFLSTVSQASESTMLKLQLLDEAIFYNRWYSLMLALVKDKQSSLYHILQSWDKHASSESRAYPLIREFRKTVLETCFTKILQPVLKQYSDFSFSMFDLEEPLWLIINAPSCDLLSEDMGSYRAKLNDILQKINIKYESAGYPTWGTLNPTIIQHPLSNISPLLSKFLDMPRTPSSGDFCVPKFLVEKQGASLRLIVKPGEESDGIYQAPTGQASNPLSPFYRLGYKEWVTGQNFPLIVQVESSIGQITLIPQE